MEEQKPTEHLNPLQRYGREIRKVREGRKLTLAQLAKAAGYSEGYASKVETGKLLPSMKFAEGCDLAFGTNGLFARMLHQITEGDHPLGFVPYLELERKASYILDLSTTLVPGLLQTEEYARAIFRAGHPHERDEVIEGKVAARLRRRQALEQARPPKLWAILQEACLRTQVGGASTMAAQLDHLVHSAESPGIDLQVIPFGAGAAGIHAMPFILLAFNDAPTVLYSDDVLGGRLYRTAAAVAPAQENYDRMRANALSPESSLAFLKTVRQEYAA